MTIPPPGGPLPPSVVDGIDVDAAAATVESCPGVTGLDGGRYHEVATYLPGRTVDGVAVDGGRVRVQVRAVWGVPIPQLAIRIKTALAPLTGSRPVDVLVADIDDPSGHPVPDLPGQELPGGQTPPGSVQRAEPSPGLPPG